MTKAICTSCLCLGLALPAWAGIYYEAQTASDARGSRDVRVQAWIDGDRAKVQFVESGNPMIKDGAYLITKDGGKTLFLVDPKEKTYSRWDLEAMLRAFGGMMDSMGGVMNLEFSDPQVEKLVEEPGGDLLGLATQHLRFRTRYGMQVKVLGMSRRSDIDMVEDFWVTDALQDPGFGIWLRKDRPTGSEDLDKLIAAEMGKVKGLPLKTEAVTTTTSGKKGKSQTTRTTTQVTELDRSRSIPAGTFEIPEGYQETEMMPGLQGGEADGGGGDNPLKGLFGRKKGG